MVTIDLNSDMGEYEDQEFLSREAQLMRLITSVNIACGVHAGNPDLMRRTARLAVEEGVAIGAHPGFPGAEDFGRKDRRASPDEILALVSMQLTRLSEALALDHLALKHVKPHGALYHLAAKEQASADALTRAVAAFDPQLLLFAPAGSLLVQSARQAGLPVAQEVFADRAYRPDGTLVSRREPGALLQTDEQVCSQLRGIVKGYVIAIDGRKIPLHANSLCIHVDTPRSLEFARLVRDELLLAGVRIAKPERF